jgi:hypothetical protein
LELTNLSCVDLNVAPKLLLMNCNAAVVSSLLLPSVLPSFTVPQQRRMVFLLLLVTTMLFPTENIVAAATGLEKERK